MIWKTEGAGFRSARAGVSVVPCGALAIADAGWVIIADAGWVIADAEWVIIGSPIFAGRRFLTAETAKRVVELAVARGAL